MPGALSSSVDGYLAFSAVKLTGYSLAGWYLNRCYSGATAHFAVVGITRTVIGMVFGAALGLLAYPLVSFGGLGILVDIFGLIPVRLVEWWIIIPFYDRSMVTKQKDWQYVGLGTGWSFALDIPALIGLSQRAVSGYVNHSELFLVSALPNGMHPTGKRSLKSSVIWIRR